MIATIQTTRHYIYKLALKLGGISILGSTVFIGGCGQDDGTDPLIGDFKLDVPIAYVKRPLDALEQLDDNVETLKNLEFPDEELNRIEEILG